MADVIVEFGAKIDELIKAVDQVKAKLNEVHESTSRATEGFNSLENVVKLAFSGAVIAGVEQFIVKLAELGERTEKTMAVLGINAQQAVQLSGMAFLAGTNIEALSLSMGRLYLNVLRSTRDAYGPASEALRVLGIRSSELTKSGGDTMGMIETLHGAVSRFNPSMNLFAAVEALAGRNVANMIPYLLLSGEKWEAFKKAVDGAQQGMDHAAPGLAETNVKIGIMELSLSGLAARIFDVFKPAIDFVIEKVTSLAQSINPDDIRSAVLKTVNWLVDMGRAIAAFFEGVVDTIKDLKAQMNSMGSAPSLAHFLGGPEGEAIVRLIEYIRKSRPEILNTKEDWTLMAEQINQTGNTAQVVESKFSQLLTMVKELTSAVLGGTDVWAAFSKSFANFIDYVGELGVTSMRKNVEAMNLSQRQMLQAEKLRAEQSIAVIKGEFELKKIQYDLDADFYKTTQMQKVLRTRDAAAEALNVELGYLTYIRDLYKGDPTQYEAAQRRLVLATQKARQEMARYDAEYFKLARAEVAGYVGAFQSSWDSSLRGVLAGTTKFADAMKKAFGDLIIYMIQQIEKKFVFEQITTALTEALFGKQVVAAVAAEGGKTAAASTGTAVRSGLNITEAVSSIGTAVGGLFAKLSEWLTPILGPAAPAAAAPVAAGVAASALAFFDTGTDYVERTGLAVIHRGEAIVPAKANTPFTGGGGATNVVNSIVSMFSMIKKLDVGTNYVTNSGLAMIHKGESIVPAQTSGPFTGGGGTTVNMSISAVDARSFANLVNSNPSIFTDLIRKAVRDNRLKLAPQV